MKNIKTTSLDGKVKKYFDLSYKYYITYEDTGVSDTEYDYLCKELYEAFDEMPEKFQKVLDKDLLKAGSGFSISLDTYKELGAI